MNSQQDRMLMKESYGFHESSDIVRSAKCFKKSLTRGQLNFE